MPATCPPPFTSSGLEPSLPTPLGEVIRWLAAAGLPGAGGPSPSASPPPLFCTFAPYLLNTLRLHRLTPLMYWRLSQGEGLGQIHPRWQAALAHDYALALREGARQDREAGEVVAALQAAGIEVIVLKGADLRLRLYNDPALRPMSDLDLLVAREQLGLTQSVLQEMGYSLSPLCAEPRPGFRNRFANELLYLPSEPLSLQIDLHWELWGGAGFYRLPYPRLAARAATIDFHGNPAPVLSPEHTVLHLCLHLFEDFYGLIQMVDLMGFLSTRGLDWGGFGEEVERFGCRGPVELVLHQLAGLVPDLVPRQTLAHLAAYRPPFLENLILTRKMGYLTNYLALMRHYSLDSWLFYLAAKLWPSPHYLARSLGLPSRAAYLRQFFKKLG